MYVGEIVVTSVKNSFPAFGGREGGRREGILDLVNCWVSL